MTIYDVKAQAYLPPFFLPNLDMGIRVFSDCLEDKTHQFSKHPEDYTLFTVGEFNDENGGLEIHPPQSLGNGVDYQNAKKPVTPEKLEAVS